MDLNRRNWLRGITLGAGATAFRPFLHHLEAAEQGQLPNDLSLY